MSSGVGVGVAVAAAYLLTISFSRSCVRTSPHCQSGLDSHLSGENTLKPPTSKCPSSLKLNSGKSGHPARGRAISEHYSKVAAWIYRSCKVLCDARVIGDARAANFERQAWTVRDRIGIRRCRGKRDGADSSASSSQTYSCRQRSGRDPIGRWSRRSELEEGIAESSESLPNRVRIPKIEHPGLITV